MISATGENLNILISCENSPEHYWMSYLCWYSIIKNLSDAKVFVCSKRNNISCFFLWTKKVNVPFKHYKDQIPFDMKSLLIIPPTVVAIRDFEEAGIEPILKNDQELLENTNFVKDSSSNDFCVFCSYAKGWGNFVTSRWINNYTCPLSVFKKFSKANMTINEKKIERIWNNSVPLFQRISGV